jgi:hypothetical protein
MINGSAGLHSYGDYGCSAPLWVSVDQVDCEDVS